MASQWGWRDYPAGDNGERMCPKNATLFGHYVADVRRIQYISDVTNKNSRIDLRQCLLDRIESAPDAVWTPNDFVDLANRAAVDKALQRLSARNELRRIDRGLYDRARHNSLTGEATVADYRAVIRAVARRDKVRVLIDGITAANDLGLTTAVPARVEVLIDARLKPIRLGSQQISFKSAVPSRLYWADRPAMRVVQALYWLKDTLDDPEERARVIQRIRDLLFEPTHGTVIRTDLRAGLSALPIWMQELLRDLVGSASAQNATPRAKPKRPPHGR
jgi:Family of unknown function (DUF6088)